MKVGHVPADLVFASQAPDLGLRVAFTTVLLLPEKGLCTAGLGSRVLGFRA